MKKERFLTKQNTGVLFLDCQERIFPNVERSCEVIQGIQTAVQAFRKLALPMVVSECSPEIFGKTLGPLRNILGSDQDILERSRFSCFAEEASQAKINEMDRGVWVILGVETHISILQTAKDLLAAGKRVVVLNDCTSSRNLFDFSTAIGELRDEGARISCLDIILFELLQGTEAKEFSSIQHLAHA